MLDADALAREVSSFPDVLKEVARAFGPEYVLKDGLNRPKLGELVFNNPEARTNLNGIIHPRVRVEMARRQTELESSGARAVVQDIPLLFENNLQTLFDATILVDAPLEIRVARVVVRDGLTPDAVRARDAAQMSPLEKRKHATVTLENDGDLSSLERQLDAALEQVGLAS